jgi:L-rhamnose mutarotase
MDNYFARYCFALDLKEAEGVVEAYESYHRAVWPGVERQILAAGVVSLQIYRIQYRLFMIMEVDETYNPQEKAQADANNPEIQRWESLMWNYQQALPGVAAGVKWVEMDLIYNLRAS